jgi:hypothetical protein
MSDFRIILLRCQWLGIIEAANENRPDPEAIRIFNGELPVHEVPVGRRAAPLQKIVVHDGQTVAYYAITCVNPGSGEPERYAYRYKIVGGKAVLDKAFPVQPCQNRREA